MNAQRRLLEEERPGLLLAELARLERMARETGEVDKAAFEGLAVRFERIEMPYRASNVRERCMRAQVALGLEESAHLRTWQHGEMVRLQAVCG